jgi:hypothetical protein
MSRGTVLTAATCRNCNNSEFAYDMPNTNLLRKTWKYPAPWHRLCRFFLRNSTEIALMDSLDRGQTIGSLVLY